ncbi:patatin-like phospholipase family protein [Streptacidiphilus sp. MAP12-20]|uniref:patatin-like phospholipase family protein n=1 Tax=Streptacidiphilus sp. MAP12-20 TaxID=3156299 RepID=UPI003514C6EF
MTTRALVLGGGGPAGVAWATGLLAGLAEAGADVTDADRLVGTSAGSVVAAQVASGAALGELYARQADPALQTREIASGVSVEALMASWAESAALEPTERRRFAGKVAVETETVSEAARREVVAARLPVHEWSTRDVVIVAVDVSDGEPVLFERTSGVGLVDAVTASCAVPGVWPPVTIGDARYMDGGMRSMCNADLAQGCDKVLIVAPLAAADGDLEAQVEGLDGAVEVVGPDAASIAAIGPNPLDPTVRTPCAEAGRAQGLALAAQIAAFWV